MKLESYLSSTGMSQADFARLVGTSEANVSRWISGARRPNWRMMRTIMTVTKGAVRPEDFLPDAGDPGDAGGSASECRTYGGVALTFCHD